MADFYMVSQNWFVHFLFPFLILHLTVQSSVLDPTSEPNVMEICWVITRTCVRSPPPVGTRAWFLSLSSVLRRTGGEGRCALASGLGDRSHFSGEGSLLNGGGSLLNGDGSLLRGDGSLLRGDGSLLRGDGSLFLGDGDRFLALTLAEGGLRWSFCVGALVTLPAAPAHIESEVSSC